MNSWGVKLPKRRYVEVWMYLLIIFSVNFFDIVPINQIIGDNGPFTFYLLSLFLMFTFKRKAWISDSKEWLIPFWLFYLGIFLSFFPAYIYYGQSFGRSFLTNRRMFELVAFPILIALKPNEVEIRRTLYAFAVTFILVSLFVTFLAPGWAPEVENEDFIEEGDYLHTVRGARFIVLALIFSLSRVLKDYNTRNFLISLGIFIILFLGQNRSSLIAALFILLYTILRMKMSSRKLMALAMLGISALLIIVGTASQWEFLYDQTINQILDPDYNRNKSVVYMFSPREPLRYILGDGFISANVNPIIHYLQESGIFHSDVGFIGLWHQYGLLPLLTILFYMFKSLFSKKKMFLVKASALYMLIGALTISYYATGDALLWLSFFFYIYYSEDLPSFRDDSRHRFVYRWEGYRYRSISNL